MRIELGTGAIQRIGGARRLVDTLRCARVLGVRHR